MLKVMVVDDALVIRKNLTRFFTSLGHEVVAEAGTGVEAISKIQEIKDIDLITMDVTMPEMDGIEATKQICELNKDVKIVMITSHGQEELVSKALKAGAKNFVLKPITQEKVEQTIGVLFPEFASKEDEDTL